jgi:hypothetical protein
MTKSEKSAILAEHLATFRAWAYGDLAARIGGGHLDTTERRALDGTEYSLTVDVFWDDKPRGDIRVIGDLSLNRPLWGFIPLFFPDVCDSFIMRPDGRFVGE